MSRLDGFSVLSPPAVQQMIYAILPQKLQERFEQDLELDASYSVPGQARFRVNVYQQRDSVGAAFRLIPRTSRAWRSSAFPRWWPTWHGCPGGWCW